MTVPDQVDRERIGRGRLLLGGLSALLLLLAGGRDEVSSGTAIAEDGPQAVVLFGLRDVRVGDDVMFAVPPFTNGTNEPLTIRSVRVVSVPSGLDVIDYRTLAFSESGGMMLTWDSRTAGGDASEWLARSHHGVEGLRVPAHGMSDRYALVHARVTARPSGPMKNVEVVYTMVNRTYQQVLTATWAIEMEGESPGDSSAGSGP